MSQIIEYKNIGKSYQGKWVVRNFNLTINEGDFLCIVGTSGSGKTTLLKMINGLVVPDEGDITINGIRVIDQDIISLRRKIGYAIQGDGLFPHMTVADNIGYVPKLDGVPKEEVDSIVNRMLSLVGLPLDSKGKYPKELSGGQQQRVGIARAYANSPKILLMDEPSAALDIAAKEVIHEYIKKFTAIGGIVILVTHDEGELGLCDRHYILKDGVLNDYSFDGNMKKLANLIGD